MAESKLSVYINTMVFTIVAGVISLILLALLFLGSDLTQRYAPLIITIEVGLLAIIVIAIVRIIMYERRMEKLQKNSIDNLLAVKSCPDYWTMSESREDGVVCNKMYEMPRDDDDPMATRVRYEMQGTSSTVRLKDFTNKKLGDLCAAVGRQESPWTDVRAVCDSFQVPSDTRKEDA